MANTTNSNWPTSKIIFCLAIVVSIGLFIYGAATADNRTGFMIAGFVLFAGAWGWLFASRKSNW